MEKIFKNCILTHEDSKILRKFKISDKIYEISHDGLDISGNCCYSICFGTVIQIVTNYYEKYTVSVQYDDTTIIRYGNLTECSLSVGSIISLGFVIGRCDNHIHLELCRPIPVQPSRIVNICNIIYYKYDPTYLLEIRDSALGDFRDGTTTFDSGDNPVAIEDEITDAIKKEFEGSN